MSIRSLPALLALAAALAAGAPAQAHEYDAGSLHIVHPHARATVPAQPTGAAYLKIENRGSAPDRLLSASTPAAQSVEIHSMRMDGNVMRMREVPSLDLPPQSSVVLEPGTDYHLMLQGLKAPLKAGDKFPMTLQFEKAGKVDVSVVVGDMKAGAGGEHMPMH
ncbi:MAG: copper chaperone PCu(A)C [Burkholderiaceae bacterium]